MKPKSIDYQNMYEAVIDGDCAYLDKHLPYASPSWIETTALENAILFGNTKSLKTISKYIKKDANIDGALCVLAVKGSVVLLKNLLPIMNSNSIKTLFSEIVEYKNSETQVKIDMIRFLKNKMDMDDYKSSLIYVMNKDMGDVLNVMLEGAEDKYLVGLGKYIEKEIDRGGININKSFTNFLSLCKSIESKKSIENNLKSIKVPVKIKNKII